jgi:hypothetical protein
MDKMYKEVPESFPGTLKLVQNNETGELSLNPNYRQLCGGENKELDYFVTRIMPAMNPGVSKFATRKHVDLISDMYTVADEAYGLLILHNEHHIWEKQVLMIKSGAKGKHLKKENKKFCSGRSGNKQGWTEEGIQLFHSLRQQVKAIRQTTKKNEETIRERFRNKMFENTTQPSTETLRLSESVTVYEYDDDLDENLSNIFHLANEEMKEVNHRFSS